MRTILIATLMALALGLVATADSPAAPASGGVIAAAADPVLAPAQYVRRHGRACYRKCYFDFVIGRRVCRTFC